MKSYIEKNVTLMVEDHDELYLCIVDESGIVQQVAILPDEILWIKEVIEQYLAKKV